MAWVQKLLPWWIAAILLALLADKASGPAATATLNIMAGVSIILPLTLWLLGDD
jgi:hypothetical protein